MHASRATALGLVSVATVAWRARGTLYLTAVVKATFELVPEGRMRPTEPDPIASGEEPDPSGVGLRTAGDLAPYLGQPEVWLTGHAVVPPRFSQPELSVQLALVQEGALRIDKQVDLDVSGATGDPPRVRIAGVGPIAEDWPVRKRWLKGIDPRVLRGPVLDIPEGLHWEYFQTAPLDQRVHALRGNEWLMLGGMIANRPRLRTQLPEAWGAARLYRRSHSLPRAGEPVPLHADTLQIDVDRLRCSILFRGRVQLGSDAELASLHLVAGLEQPGREVVWVDPFATAAQGAPEIPFGGTMGIPDDVSAVLAALPSTPFKQAQPAVLIDKPDTDIVPFAETFMLSDDISQRLAAALATPFAKPSAAPPASDIPFSGTMGLPDHVARALSGAPATPFQAGPVDVGQRLARDRKGPVEGVGARLPPPSGTEEPALSPMFTGTMTLPDGIADKLVAGLATPFEHPTPASAAVPLDFSGTLALPDDLSERLAAMLGTPFKARREATALDPAPFRAVEKPMAPGEGVLVSPPLPLVAPVPVAAPAVPRLSAASAIAAEDAGLLPGGLGAEFLAAIAEAGAPDV